ncbi:MAG: FtsX-like permease family protein [Candidatus Hydrogenedentes bacterium]|nr:FtsX-like permease family protein [Candidatus Hydrogenedentota bacterium]
MRVLDKKLLRTLWWSRGQSLAVAAVVLCGTACYIAIASAHSNLELTRSTYYAHYRFADFEIMLERAPLTSVFRLESLPGVRQVRGRIVEDVNVDLEGADEPRIGRIVSMPNRQEHVINDICLLEGRYFSEGNPNEVILSKRFAEANRLVLGDRIEASIDNKKHSLRIVGIALSPEYVYMIRSVQELVPNSERFGILWVPQEFAETALDMKEACNNIVGSVEDPEQLDAILERAEDMLKPYGVFAKVKGEDQISNRFISDEIKGLEVMAKIIPALFQGIAALVLLVLLNRMVRKERTEIGLLKAYGYSSLAVAFHYVKYALALSIAGSLAGFAVGQWLANGMIRMYVEFYDFPLLRSRVYFDILARSMAIGIGFSLLGALFAALRAMRIRPAESMRPEAPRYAHRTLLERVPALWRRLSFTWKMIGRNMSRNAFRSSLNAFGVMISSGILIMGFFSLDAMDYMLEFQFEVAQREDVKVSFQIERGKDALYEAARFDHVRYAEPLLQYPFEVRSEWRKKDVVVIGVPRGARLQRLINAKQEPVDVGATGLTLSDRLARDLGVGVGDTLTLKPLMGRITKERTLVVSQIVEQYLGSSAYMDFDALSRLLDEPFAANAVLLRVERGMERDLSRHLKDVPGVAAVEIKADSLKGLQDTIEMSAQISNTMNIVFAAVIAFAVIYNITAVSLAERQRELASLRVLGFTTQEVGRILYHENFALCIVGLILGIPFGAGICRLLVNAYDNELYRLPFHLDTGTFVTATVLSFFFVVLANLAVRRQIRKLDMVEVLKERE